MIYRFVKYSITLLLSVALFQATAQNMVAHVYGQLKDHTTKKKLEGCMVQVMKDGSVFDSYDAGSSGKYDFELPLGFTYDIKFSKGDYLSKIIRIDTRNIPEEEMAGGFDMQVDGTLFPYREGFNTDLLKDPMARAFYDPSGDGLVFDFPYTEKKSEMIDKEFKRLDDIAKNFEKLKADFDRYVQEGDQKMMEKKYLDAVSNYKSALAIFPKEEPVKAKLADAQAKLDAENANKDFEAQYKKLIEEGDALYKDRKYADAKKKFTKARDMKNGTYEKEMMYKCDLALEDAENRAIYDGIVADADKKFNNKDFAVSIEKYKEASKMYPTESYPKDQILKAESALKDMLAYEAEKLRIQREYDDKMALGQRSYEEDKLEQAISHYSAASDLKPQEQAPKDKIAEIEAMIADRKSQKEQDDANALANAERDRIEKEYNDIIAVADEMFIKEELAEARVKYQDALVVKPEAQYPASKIETIDLLLAQQEELASMSAAKALEDSLAAIALAEQLAADERMRALMEQERLDSERKQRELEEERLAAEAKLKAKKKNWDSNVDREAEDQVEEYYRSAFEKEYATKKQMKAQEIDEFVAFHARKDKDAQQLIERNEELVRNSKENQSELASIGSSIQNAAIADNERKKKDVNKDQNDYRQRADNRISDSAVLIDEKKEIQASVAQNDRARLGSIERTNDKIEQRDKNMETYQRKGDTSRAENKMKAERSIEKQQQMSFDGEEVRKANEDVVESKMQQSAITDKDERQAADQRITNSNLKINQKKNDVESIAEGKEIGALNNANDIEMKKKDFEFEEKRRENESSNQRYETRKEAFSKKAGEPKSEEEYLAVPGTEQLKQGVTENSYKLGNKMVTERSVKIGNKVDKYKKVVSKTAIYYFRNGQSITQATWRQATLAEPE